jgi:hypothetical protein
MTSIHKFPPANALYQLAGKSNFHLWLSAIKPYLFSNIESTGLILGGWTEPKTTSKETEWDRERWLIANTETCRFIRGTLAINVIPHVRQHNNAKSLWHNLLWLYGEESGIDTQGGPPVPGSGNARNLHGGGRTKLLAALAKNRASIDLDLDLGVVSPVPSSPSLVPPVIRAFGSASSSKSYGTFLEVPSFDRPEEEEDDDYDYDYDYDYEGGIIDNPPQPSLLYSPPIPITDPTITRTDPIPNNFNDGKGNETHTPRVHIRERVRVSADASLEIIPEEAHPGRRVDLTESSVFVRRRSIFSPHATRGRAIRVSEIKTTIRSYSRPFQKYMKASFSFFF